MIRAAAAALLAFAGSPAVALTCEGITFEGIPYTICEVAPRKERLRLFLEDAGGRPYGDFAAVEAEHGPLAFATNAGMYHATRRPVGLFLRDGEEVAPLVTSDGPGNFGMLPNGLLCLNDEGAFVLESRAGPFGRDQPHQGLPHAPRGARHHQSRPVRHPILHRSPPL